MDDEQDRIAGVYRTYDTTPEIQRKWSRENPGNQFLGAARTGALERLLAQQGLTPLAEKRILDVGCGTGEFLGMLCSCGATPSTCHGIDVLPDRIRRAREAFGDIAFHVGDARTMPFDTGAFDVVFANMVFSSVLDTGVARQLAAEIRRVLAPEGAIVWHDHRYPNPWNKQVRHYTLRDIHDLFGGARIHAVSIAPVPPLVRRLGAATHRVAPLLDAIPILRVDYLAVLRLTEETRPSAPRRLTT